MQLFALNAHDQLTAASKGSKRVDYQCLECKGVVRLRSGLHRQPHFFHLHPSLTCRLSAKSMTHLQVQCHLQKRLPNGECKLEMRFPSIQRVADVVWLPRKIIFEVQCSPISTEEVRSRMKDYAAIGYQVVWILHDKLYNQFRLSAAELSLRTSPYYYTNMDAEGRGCIYDQFDVWCRGLRLRKLPALSVDVTKPQSIPVIAEQNYPKMIFERLESWSFHFGDDLIDRQCPDYLARAQAVEQELLPAPPSKTVPYYFKKFILRPYQLLFQLLLERACK